jgi:hypothetical protein
VAAVFSTISAKPPDFFVTGYEPRLLAQGVVGDDPTFAMRAELEDVQKRINHNRAALERSAKWLVAGLWVGIGAIPTAVVAFIVLAIWAHFS